MESPTRGHESRPLNESPSEKEGKSPSTATHTPTVTEPSMKVPPKRKGNFGSEGAMRQSSHPLNESPSEKEGKSLTKTWAISRWRPSMKVPPKRKGNP